MHVVPRKQFFKLYRNIFICSTETSVLYIRQYKVETRNYTLADTISDLIFNDVGSRNHTKIGKQVGLTT